MQVSNLNPDIAEYINGFPSETQKLLQQLRATIIELVPEATECFRYGIPTFQYYGNLVHFAGYKKHIGFYPAPSAIIHFKEELISYKQSKGAIQFPLDKELDIELIRKIVVFRKIENELKAKNTCK